MTHIQRPRELINDTCPLFARFQEGKFDARCTCGKWDFAMPITCRACGATGKHLTVHCPDRAAVQPDVSPKSKGKKQKAYEQMRAFVGEETGLPWLIHDCSRGKVATRIFLRIRPSTVNWKKVSWLSVRRSKETRKQDGKNNVLQLKDEWKRLTEDQRLPREKLLEHLKGLSVRCNVLGGKWLFFSSEH